MLDTTRREFIALVGGGGLLLAVKVKRARGQQPAMPVVGFLHSASPGPFARAVDAFRQGLNETGYIEGRNVAVEYRWAEGQYERLPGLAADLVRRQVSVIVAVATNGPARAAKAATASIPIVFVTGGDPVSGGIVSSFNRPAGNITGVTWVATALVPKQLDLLRGSTRNPALIGALVNPSHSDHDVQLRELQEAGAAVGKNIYIVQAATALDIDMAFASLVQKGAEALIVANDPFFISCRDQIVALAARYRIPAMYFTREFTEAGGLMSYGASLIDAARQGGIYAGKILHGAKPADLPVMQSVKFEFVINLKTAKDLSLEIPPTMLALADEVIE
jgi:putative tryptophan/tyrosine transport system substrate-binding protein